MGKNTSNTTPQTLSFQKFKDKVGGGLALGQYSIIGYGEAHSTYDPKKKDHIVKLDMNPAVVARSLKPVEEKLYRAFFEDLTAFYNKDNNEYTKDGKTFRLSKSIDKSALKLKLYVETSALGKSHFTYLYKFELSFSDDGDTIKWMGGLDKLESQLDDFKKKVLNLCNKRISGKGILRKEKHLDFKRVLHVVTQYYLSNIQKLAPVLSAVNGKFELSNVDITSSLTTMEDLSLGARSTNIDGTFNDEVFDYYCEGKSDFEIVRSLGSCLSTFREMDLSNGKVSKLKFYAHGVLTAGVGAFTPYLNLVNDIYGSTGNSLGRTKSFSWLFKKNKKKQKYEQISSQCFSVLDFFITLSGASNITSCVGALTSAVASVVQTKKTLNGEYSFPRVLIDVATDIGFWGRNSPISLDPYKSDQKQWVNDNNEAISSTHEWLDSGGSIVDRPFKKDGMSVDSSFFASRRQGKKNK